MTSMLVNADLSNEYVVDADSHDGTPEIAAHEGAEVHQEAELLPSATVGTSDSLAGQVSGSLANTASHFAW